MKRIITKVIFIGIIACGGLIYACGDKFLALQPIGSLSESTLANNAAVNKLLIGAYSLLDGVGQNPDNWTATTYPWLSPASNWSFGSVASDDSHKGSEYGDVPDYEVVENYSVLPTTPAVGSKWLALYGGVQRANDVLRLLDKVTDNSISTGEKLQIQAESRFLRALFHFEAAKMWKNVPYIDETISFEAGNYNVSNTTPIWPKIEEDFLFAATNLTATKSEVGRANSWAAKAFLAKTYMFQDKFTEAKPVLEDIIANGTTPLGVKYDLAVKFNDSFNPATQNNMETIFSYQSAVNDGATEGNNGNAGDLLNWPIGGPSGCCGFNQPSFSLVNSYKTDPVTGLPLLDTWNNSDVTNDQGLGSNDPFTPYTGTLDPRLDWTVGRRGIPYLDWGLAPGRPWIFSQPTMGPYVPIKNIYWKKDKASLSQEYAFGAFVSANDLVYIRFADILLWAAEAEIEVGSLTQAEAYVNRVRQRAANPVGWVKTYVDNSDPSKGFTNTPAANYFIGLYTGQFTAQGKDYARKAVRFERKLELAMEGHRFFDLQRWDDGTGYMADVLNAYLAHENSVPNFTNTYLSGASFTKGKNEIYPIPQDQIDVSVTNGTPTLVQNPGY